MSTMTCANDRPVPATAAPAAAGLHRAIPDLIAQVAHLPATALCRPLIAGGWVLSLGPPEAIADVSPGMFPTPEAVRAWLLDDLACAGRLRRARYQPHITRWELVRRHLPWWQRTARQMDPQSRVAAGLPVVRASHVPSATVRASVAAADAGGKHGRVQSWCIVPDQTHVLLDVPLLWLDHEYADRLTGAPDASFFTREREARLRAYASQGPVAQMPPIYATVGHPHPDPRSCLACVQNGNHRVEVAWRAGVTSIPTWMTQDCYARWTTVLGARIP